MFTKYFGLAFFVLMLNFTGALWSCEEEEFADALRKGDFLSAREYIKKCHTAYLTIQDSPLHYAVNRQDAVLIFTLIYNNHDINFQSQPSGFTALHIAVLGGKQEFVVVLLNEGADPNARNNQGYTPFELAQQLEEFEIAEILKTYMNIYHCDDR